MFPKARLDTSRIPELIRSYGGKLKMMTGETPGFLYQENQKNNKDSSRMIQEAERILEELGRMAQ